MALLALFCTSGLLASGMTNGPPLAISSRVSLVPPSLDGPGDFGDDGVGTGGGNALETRANTVSAHGDRTRPWLQHALARRGGRFEAG
ncbi:hypothetical protein GQ53DRAFT_749655 [Thozetella sp. PMI_491]|nr:hypothetical protein GQ53DRAFT_749655 [Thozetella sp. PMI_491]